jgi:hypothetical protein
MKERNNPTIQDQEYYLSTRIHHLGRHVGARGELNMMKGSEMKINDI